MLIFAAVFQWTKKNILFVLWLLFFIFSIIGMRHYGGKNISPFIQTPQSAFGKHFSWAYDCFSCSEIRWYVFADVLFALLLFVLVVYLYPKLKKHSDKPVENKSTYYLIFCSCAGLACVVDWVEGVAIYNESDWFLKANMIKIVFYVITWVWFFYEGIKYLLRKWWNTEIQALLQAFVQQYFHYFYPGIISIVAFYFIVNSLDQFDALIYDLAGFPNLVIFIILFAATLIKVWFLPYYVQFSNVFYDLLEVGEYDKGNTDHKKLIVVSSQNLPNVLSWKGVFLPIVYLLKKEISAEANKKRSDSKEEEEARIAREISMKVRPMEIDLWPLPDKNLPSNWLNSLFHIVRRHVGLLFILIFFWLLMKALTEVKPLIKGLDFVLVGVAGLALLGAMYALVNYVRNSESKKIKVGGKVEWIKGPDAQEERRRVVRIGAIVLLIITVVLWALTTYFYSQEASIRSVLIYLSLATLSAALLYVFFVVFRYPTADWLKPEEKKNVPSHAGYEERARKIKLINDKSQKSLTFLLICFMTVVIPGAFIIVVVLSLINLSLFSFVNPINYYLLFINGVVAILAIANRLTLLRLARMKFLPEKKSPVFSRITSNSLINRKDQATEVKEERGSYLLRRLALTLTICIVIFLLRQGNNYHHQINYLPPAEKEALSFEKYTENFLAQVDTTNGDKDIYFIAAEGGGLRAAYWTMLVLNRLGPEVQQRTFMMSGASGGAIGQGVMTYLNYQDVDINREVSVIKDIGEFNFLTTDLAGILTRGVLGSIVPLDSMTNYWDRHRYMVREYFHLMGGEQEKTAYWENGSQQPFYALWSESKQLSDHLPFVVVNTTRTRDGSRGVVHPFPGTTDLFQNYHDLSQNFDGDFISFADAVFLTNRFPAVSPAARIADKGYFVDGGYYDNSGLQSIIEVLQYAHGRAIGDTSSVFRELLELKPVVINIRNSGSAFYAEKLADWHITEDSVNLASFNREIGSIVGAITLSGTDAIPNFYHKLLGDSLTAKAYKVGEYKTIDLPYRIDDTRDLHTLLGGQIVTDSCRLNDLVESLKVEMAATYGKDPTTVLKPALGRSISDPTLRYMEKMLGFPKVKTAIESLKK